MQAVRIHGAATGAEQAEPELEALRDQGGLEVGRDGEGGAAAHGGVVIPQVPREIEGLAGLHAAGIALVTEAGRGQVQAYDPVARADSVSLGPVHDGMGRAIKGGVDPAQEGPDIPHLHRPQGRDQAAGEPLVGQGIRVSRKQRARGAVAAPHGEAAGGARELRPLQLLQGDVKLLDRVSEAEAAPADAREQAELPSHCC